jgi:hypothetical protein
VLPGGGKSRSLTAAGCCPRWLIGLLNVVALAIQHEEHPEKLI